MPWASFPAAAWRIALRPGQLPRRHVWDGLFTVLFMVGGGFPMFTLAWLGNRPVQSLDGLAW